MQKVLEYKEWRKFLGVIDKAKRACDNSNIKVYDHFVEADKMVEIGSGAKRKEVDYKLSRYACYLIVQNADPRKRIIALGQTYFAIQTRKQEITEQEYDSLSNDEKRFYQRRLTKQGNYTLQRVAVSAGVKDMAEFHNAGYRGLYNGETADDIFKRKKLRYKSKKEWIFSLSHYIRDTSCVFTTNNICKSRSTDKNNGNGFLVKFRT